MQMVFNVAPNIFNHLNFENYPSDVDFSAFAFEEILRLRLVI